MPTMRVSTGVPRLVFEDQGSPLSDGMWTAASTLAAMPERLAALQQDKQARAQAQANLEAEWAARATAAQQAQANFMEQQRGAAEDRALRRQAMEADIALKSAEESRRMLGMWGTGINEAAKRGIDLLEAGKKGGSAAAQQRPITKNIWVGDGMNQRQITVQWDPETGEWTPITIGATPNVPEPGAADVVPEATEATGDTGGSLLPTLGATAAGAAGLGAAYWNRQPLMDMARRWMTPAAATAPSAPSATGLWGRVAGRAAPFLRGASIAAPAIGALKDTRDAIMGDTEEGRLAEGLQAVGQAASLASPASRIASIPATLMGEAVQQQVRSELEPSGSAMDTIRAYAAGKPIRPGLMSRLAIGANAPFQDERQGRMTQDIVDTNIEEIANAVYAVKKAKDAQRNPIPDGPEYDGYRAEQEAKAQELRQMVRSMALHQPEALQQFLRQFAPE